jgi:hypothetical protein
MIWLVVTGIKRLFFTVATFGIFFSTNVAFLKPMPLR